jgi:hypothetical protein
MAAIIRGEPVGLPDASPASTLAFDMYLVMPRFGSEPKFEPEPWQT